MIRKPFSPRPYQSLIVDHIHQVPRCGVWAGMGLGKSVSTLTALDGLFMAGEDHPVLVLAPLRVARTTWPDEARKWSHLRHVSVMPIVGSEKERRAALRFNASVYTCNYDNLEWLVEYYGERWPFRTVIADESTKLKSFRLRQGGKRAAALAKVAHTKAKRFVQLTGTPAPNGLNDLWGQMWFLDAGQRLGRTYDAFRQRWFQKSFDGYSMTPLANAQQEIQDKLKDICITIDAADWFDLEAPIVNNVYVDLPPRARRLYADMEKQMFMEIEGHDVEAFNAAARTLKCLAAGTEVLTDSGWVNIEDFTPDKKVWDGAEWVSACNLVCNGTKTVINCWAVWMTPDHKVLTDQGWREAREVVYGEPTKKYARHDVWVPDRNSAPWVRIKRKIKPRDLGSALRMWVRNSCGWGEPAQQEPRGKEILRMPAWRNVIGRVGHPRHDWAPHMAYVVRHARKMLQSKKQRLEKLRRTRDNRLRAMVGFFYEFLFRYGFNLVRGREHRTSGQQPWLFAQQLPMGGGRGTREQSTYKRVGKNPDRVDDRGASLTAVQNTRADDTAETQKKLGARGFSKAAKVYDIVNAGPRHRFTVRGSDRIPFIAHNCLQLANGAAYVDDKQNWKEVHDAKLEALDEIVEEAMGAPVMVAYHFKSDLARLKRAFPKGRELDANPATIRDWNEGKIPVLFAHPASAGHGLNLQDGGNILVYFSHDWNLENRMQILERIGPTRQMQAGHKRPVFVHNIIARDTVDEMVIERVDTKREVQDILLAAMKRKGLL